MVWTCSESGRGEITKKGYEMEPTRTEGDEVDLKLAGRKELED